MNTVRAFASKCWPKTVHARGDWKWLLLKLLTIDSSESDDYEAKFWVIIKAATCCSSWKSQNKRMNVLWIFPLTLMEFSPFNKFEVHRLSNFWEPGISADDKFWLSYVSFLTTPIKTGVLRLSEIFPHDLHIREDGTSNLYLQRTIWGPKSLNS